MTTRHVGRRRGARVRRLPDRFTLAGSPWLVKASASAAVVSGVAVSVAMPSEADTIVASTNLDASLAERTTESASRQQARGPIVSSPEQAAPAAISPSTISGVTAVKKPTPKPAPEAPAPATSAAGSSGSAPAGSAPAAPSAPPAGGSTDAYAGAGAALGLTPNAQRVYSVVRSTFGITTIGGMRPGDPGDHGTGRAVDVMTSNFGQGDAVAALVQSRAGELNVNYIIWRQRIWFPGRGWQPMADRGSATANHYDHVHISVY